MFCICSRIFSISDFKSTTILFAISKSCALEPMVFASRLNSCIQKIQLASYRLAGGEDLTELMDVAAQADRFFCNGNLFGKHCRLGQERAGRPLYLLCKNLLQFGIQALGAVFTVFGESSSTRATSCSMVCRRLSRSCFIFSPSALRISTKFWTACCATCWTACHISSSFSSTFTTLKMSEKRAICETLTSFLICKSSARSRSAPGRSGQGRG